MTRPTLKPLYMSGRISHTQSVHALDSAYAPPAVWGRAHYGLTFVYRITRLSWLVYPIDYATVPGQQLASIAWAPTWSPAALDHWPKSHLKRERRW